jgi:hypothetical protein
MKFFITYLVLILLSPLAMSQDSKWDEYAVICNWGNFYIAYKNQGNGSIKMITEENKTRSFNIISSNRTSATYDTRHPDIGRVKIDFQNKTYTDKNTKKYCDGLRIPSSLYSDSEIADFIKNGIYL